MAAAVALLQSGLVNMNARDWWGSKPAHWAASYTQPRVLEVLSAAGADLQAHNEDDDAPIDCALWTAHKKDDKVVRVLVANGARLSTVREHRRSYITPDLEAFERGVLRCRAVRPLWRCCASSGPSWCAGTSSCWSNWHCVCGCLLYTSPSPRD